jgi:hypothetical protein
VRQLSDDAHGPKQAIHVRRDATFSILLDLHLSNKIFFNQVTEQHILRRPRCSSNPIYNEMMHSPCIGTPKYVKYMTL